VNGAQVITEKNTMWTLSKWEDREREIEIETEIDRDSERDSG